MSLAQRLTRPRTRSADTGSVVTLESAFGGMFGHLLDDDTGRLVTVDVANGLPAVGSAIRAISRNIGTLPLLTYQGDGADRQRAVNDPVYDLLRRRPNSRMPAVVLWTTIARHLAGWGNAYLGKEFDGNGRLVALWPIRPEQVGEVRISLGETIRDHGQVWHIQPGTKVFDVVTLEGRRIFTPDEVVHIMGDSDDGIVGLSPIAQHRKAIGAALALQQYGARAVRNRAVPTGVLKIKGRLKDGAQDKKRIRAEWESIYRDAGNAHKIAVLDDGAEFSPISLPLQDAQYIEQIQASVRDVARIFNVPVGKLQGTSGDSLTYKTLESNQLEFLIDGLRPPMIFIQEALVFDPDLFPPRSGRYCEFLVDALLQVDASTRAKINALATAGSPWKRPSEVRTLENDPYDEGFDYVPAQARLTPAGLTQEEQENADAGPQAS